MTKATILIIALAAMFLGGLAYQFILHPNPYTGKSSIEENAVTDQAP
jgi:hypothetical protein